MKQKSILYALFLITVGIVFGIVLVTSLSNGVNFSFAGGEPVKLGAQSPINNQNPDIKTLNQPFIEVAKAVTPTVVSINVVEKTAAKEDMPQDFFHFFGPDFKFPEPQPQMGSGSGFIINSKGYILTNNHVVSGASENGIEVILNDNRHFKNAKVVGTDPTTDIAVIKIDAENLPTSTLGNSENIQVGEWVLAIGNPLGLQSTVTAGIISAIGRGNIGVIQDSYGIENFLQTDAAINPGNSGGPLVNLSGEVVGINSAIATTNARYQGYGFAVPINIAKYVAQDIIEYGKVRRGYLGVQIKPIDEKMAKGLELDKTTGVLVDNIVKDGAAEKAGLKAGDVILQIDGKEMKAPNQVQSYIATKHPGDVVKLNLNRDGKAIEKSVRLASRTSDDEVVASKSEKNKKSEEGESPNTVSFDQLGFSVKNLSPDQKDNFKLDHGILVTEIKPGNEAQKQGLAKNDIILEVNRKQVQSTKDLKEAIQRAKDGDVLLLRVRKSEDVVTYISLEFSK
jgi:serine protease Do